MIMIFFCFDLIYFCYLFLIAQFLYLTIILELSKKLKKN